jgi:hypothetical protein
MAEKKSPAGGADFIAKIVKDPKNPPDTVVLTGYLGASSEDDHTRLYSDPGLGSYVEIPDDAILHSEPVAGDSLGARRVWIKRDAVLIHGPAGSQRPKGTFLEGPIMQAHLGAAAGGAGGVGGGGGIFTWFPICPTLQPGCPTDLQASWGPGCPPTPHMPCVTWICAPTLDCPPPPTAAVHCPPTPHKPCQFTVDLRCMTMQCTAALCPSNAFGCVTVGGCQLQSAACQHGGAQVAQPMAAAAAMGPMVAAPPQTVLPACDITPHCAPTPHQPCPTPQVFCDTLAPPCIPIPTPQCPPTPQPCPTPHQPCLTGPTLCCTAPQQCHTLPPQCHPTVPPQCPPTPLQHCPTGPTACCTNMQPGCLPTVAPCHSTPPQCQPTFFLICQPTLLQQCHPTLPPQCHPTLAACQVPVTQGCPPTPLCGITNVHQAC